MNIDRPIFILGNIRSGTTITYNLVSLHPGVCWFSNHSSRYPAVYGIPILHRLLDLGYFRRRQAQAVAENRRMYPGFNFVPWPEEGDRIYHEYSGFGQTTDGVENVLTDEMSRLLTGKIREHLELTGRRRFVSKQTANNRRIDLLDRLFPDARYVHVIRDGRAVANSTLRVPWWKDMHLWWLGRTVREWEAGGGESAELAGINWKRTLTEIFRTRDRLGDRYTELRYEALTEDVRGSIRRVFEFCEMDCPEDYLALLPEQLPDMNRKWREQLTASQQTALRSAIGVFLSDLGYPPD
jgi:hypothetical protein